MRMALYGLGCNVVGPDIEVTYLRDPSVDDIAKVRFEIGDTEQGSYQLDDKEIAYALDREGNNIYLAAARCADHLAARYARKGEIRTGGMTINKISPHRYYLELAVKLRRRATNSSSFVMLGTDTARISSLKTDTSITQPKFTVGMHDNNE